MYSFDSNGVGKQVTIKTKSGIWKYFKTSNNTKYVYAENIPTVTNFLKCNANFSISSTNFIGITFKYLKDKEMIGGFGSSTKVSIKINGKIVSSSEKVNKVINNYEMIVLSDSQYQLLLNSLKVDGNKINITVTDDWGSSIGTIQYSFDFDSTGFNDVYSNLQ